MELRLASFRSSCLPPRIIKRISRTARARANARTRVGKSFCSLSRPAPSTTGGAPGVKPRVLKWNLGLALQLWGDDRIVDSPNTFPLTCTEKIQVRLSYCFVG